MKLSQQSFLAMLIFSLLGMSVNLLKFFTTGENVFSSFHFWEWVGIAAASLWATLIFRNTSSKS